MNTKYIFTVGFFLLVSLSSFGQNCNKGEQRTKEEIEREKRDREWWEAGNHAMCTRVANGRDKSYGESFQTVYERCMKRFHYDNTHPKHKDIPIQGSKDPNELTGINGWMEITADGPKGHDGLTKLDEMGLKVLKQSGRYPEIK